MRLFQATAVCKRGQKVGDLPTGLRGKTNQHKAVARLNNGKQGQTIIGLKDELEKMNPVLINS